MHGKYLWIPMYVDTHMHIRMINGGSPVDIICWMMVSKNSTLSSVSFHALLTLSEGKVVTFCSLQSPFTH